MRVPGRTAIVTGASSGIGRATARELAAKRANVVLASRNRERLEGVARDLITLPGRLLVVPTDVTERLAVEALVRRTLEEFGSVDILVNNAGMGLYGPIVGGSLENMHRLFNVNFWGAMHCIQAAVPYMLSQKRGHVVNVASVAGRIAPPYLGVYAATKFAMRAISDSLRSEIAGTGVKVTTVLPGFTQTSFTENMVQEADAPTFPPFLRFADSESVAERIIQAIRFGIREVYVSPEDIAAVGLNAVAPQLVDWTMRMFMKPYLPKGEDEPEASEGTPEERRPADAEPESENA